MLLLLLLQLPTPSPSPIVIYYVCVIKKMSFDGVYQIWCCFFFKYYNQQQEQQQTAATATLPWVRTWMILTATTLIKLIYRMTTNYLIYNFHGHRKALWENKISLHLHCCVISVVVDSVVVIIINDGWYQTACVEYVQSQNNVQMTKIQN